jgi:DNA primase
LFSIRDVQGRPVAFGGRVLPGDDSVGPAKYVNSPETPLFRKSETLYALQLAKEAIRRSEPKTVLVMEGYTDVIAAHQAGFENAVAVLGTALGEGHVRLLKRFADRIVLVLDGDEAGQKRAGEVLELFVAQQVDLHVVTLPEGSDPADFLREHGPEAFADLIETRALGALDHAFAAATRDLDIEHDLTGADRALEQLLAIIAKAPILGAATDAQRQAREWRILAKLSSKFQIPETTVRSRLRELRRRGSRRRIAQPGSEAKRGASELDPAASELLQMLLFHPERLDAVRVRVRAEQFGSASCGRIFETMCRLADAGSSPSLDRLLLEFDEPEIKNLLVSLEEGGQGKTFDDVEMLIHSISRKEEEQRGRLQVEALREGKLDKEAEKEVVLQIFQQERQRQQQLKQRGSSEPTDG